MGFPSLVFFSCDMLRQVWFASCTTISVAMVKSKSLGLFEAQGSSMAVPWQFNMFQHLCSNETGRMQHRHSRSKHAGSDGATRISRRLDCGSHPQSLGFS